jgi:hypothetical protein
LAVIFELGSSIEFIRVTAEYSNAVLVAVLPYVSDVAHRLDLPIHQPVNAADVSHCSIMPSRIRGDVRAEIGLKEGWAFNFREGHIQVIQGPRSYSALQDPDEVPTLYGRVNTSRADAIRLARDTIRKLGIPLEDVFAEQVPRVTEPERLGTNVIPRYQVAWLDPRQGAVPSVEIEIDAEAKRVERVVFSSIKNLERPPPRIPVNPPRQPSPFPPRNPEYARKLVPIVLKAIDEYGKKLALPIPRPLTTNHVALLSLGDNGGWPHCEVQLTNGWRFVYRNSVVNGYYAPDNLFSSDDRTIHIKEFTGAQRLSEKDAVNLIRRAINKLNYPRNRVHMDFEPGVYRPALPGIPRIFMFWNTEDENDLQSKVEAEVDLEKGELKSLYHDDKAYWNKPPPIDVPLSLPVAETNATPPPSWKRLSPPSMHPPGRFKTLPVAPGQAGQHESPGSNKPPRQLQGAVDP